MLLPSLAEMGDFMQQPQAETYGTAKLFIGGLSYDTTDASLASYFEQYGAVLSAIVLRDPVTAHSRGFGFVTFASEHSAQRVLAYSRTHVVDGRKVEAKVAVPRNQTRKPPVMAYPGYLPPMDYLNFQPLRVPYEYDYQQTVYPNVNVNVGAYDSYRNNRELYQPEVIPGHSGTGNVANSQVNIPQDPVPVTDEVEVNTAARRPTHPNPTQPLVSPRKLRNFSMPPSALETLSHGLDALSLQNEADFEPNRVFVEDIPTDATEGDLLQTFGRFGAEKANVSVGFAVLQFRDASAAAKLLDFEKNNGPFRLRGYSVTLRSFGHTSSIHDNEFLAKPLVRANSLPLAEKPPQLLRANSVFEDRRSTLMREDKMRSLSFTQQLGNQRRPLFNDASSERRSSSFEHGRSPLTK